MSKNTLTEGKSELAVAPVKRGPYKTKAPSRGGARPNSGRKKGSTAKITATELLDDFNKQSGMSFNQFINKKILEADKTNNQELVAKYVLGLIKYYVKDVHEIDVTSNGFTLQNAQIVFNTLANPGFPDDAE